MNAILQNQLSFKKDNLLDNWYFLNPINRKNVSTNIPDGEVTIDRWGKSGGGTVSLTEEGISITPGTELLSVYFYQKLYLPFAELAGKTLTLSALKSDGSIITASGTVAAIAPEAQTAYIESDGDELQFYYNPDTAPYFQAFLNTLSGTSVFVAAKLEIGSSQTLATYSDTSKKYELNEVPNYGEQYTICRAYNVNNGTWTGLDTQFYPLTGGEVKGNIVAAPTTGNFSCIDAMWGGAGVRIAMNDTSGFFQKINGGTAINIITIPKEGSATFYGSITGNAASATKLVTARSLKTNLGSTTAVTFDGSGNQDAIPVTGTLAVAHGGTGATDAATARSNLQITPANIGALASNGNAVSATTAASCTGNAATATRLANGANINGVLFNGSNNITVYDNTKMPLNGLTDGVDFNTLLNSGFYQALGNNVNSPLGNVESHFHVIVMRHTDIWVRQYAFNVRDNTEWTRARTNSTWSAWQKMSHDGVGVAASANYATSAGTASSCSGNAATATYATSAGSAPANGGTSAACTGNAATATTATKVGHTLTFNGAVSTSFNGSANATVTIPSIPTSLPANGGTAANVSGIVAVANGGTGATDAATARSNLQITPANIGAATTNGNNASGTWGISITGSAGSAATASSCSGNANSATYASNSASTLTTSCLRNIKCGTSAPSSLSTGEIFLVYE